MHFYALFMITKVISAGKLPAGKSKMTLSQVPSVSITVGEFLWHIDSKNAAQTKGKQEEDFHFRPKWFFPLKIKTSTRAKQHLYLILTTFPQLFETFISSRKEQYLANHIVGRSLFKNQFTAGSRPAWAKKITAVLEIFTQVLHKASQLFLKALPANASQDSS